jgi:hypothetical protein
MIATIESLVLPDPPAPPNRPSRVEELQQTASASRLGLWHQCRFKFYFRYVLRLQKPPTPALHVGKVVHAVLQAWNLARWRREPFVLERFQGRFDRSWQEENKGAAIDWDGEEPEQRATAWSMLETYFAQTPIRADEPPEAVEVRVEANLAEHGLPILIGILDLVRAGGRIVDFKTAGKTPDAKQAEHQHESQLCCYSVLYRDATGQREAGLELHHLVKLKTPKVIVTPLGPMTDKQQARLFRSLESYVEGLARNDFVPSPGFHCAGCEVLAECRLWAGKDLHG